MAKTRVGINGFGRIAIFAESTAESLSQMGTEVSSEVSSDRPGRAMRSNYPERTSTTGYAGHDPA